MDNVSPLRRSFAVFLISSVMLVACGGDDADPTAGGGTSADSDPNDKPTEPGVPASAGATELAIIDLVEGDGAVLEAGQTAVLDFVVFRGDTLVEIDDYWGIAAQIVMNESGNMDGLIQGMIGMKIGGMRTITIPPELGFGPEGDPSGGLPADTDVIVVVQLLGVY